MVNLMRGDLLELISLDRLIPSVRRSVYLVSLKVRYFIALMKHELIYQQNHIATVTEVFL